MRQCLRIEVISASSASRKRRGPITKAKRVLYLSDTSNWVRESQAQSQGRSDQGQGQGRNQLIGRIGNNQNQGKDDGVYKNLHLFILLIVGYNSPQRVVLFLDLLINLCQILVLNFLLATFHFKRD